MNQTPDPKALSPEILKEALEAYSDHKEFSHLHPDRQGYTLFHHILGGQRSLKEIPRYLLSGKEEDKTQEDIVKISLTENGEINLNLIEKALCHWNEQILKDFYQREVKDVTQERLPQGLKRIFSNEMAKRMAKKMKLAIGSLDL